jgi:CheY-like chemotaxis protein
MARSLLCQVALTQQASMQHRPLAKRSNGPGQAPAKAARRVPTIILADDSIFQRMMTRALLEAEGYHVLEAGNGQEALELVRLTHPDLILMDVAMPSMDGVTAARRIRDHAAGVPIVFVTARGASGDRANALAAGGSDYLVKPIAERELLKVVEGHVNRR